MSGRGRARAQGLWHTSRQPPVQKTSTWGWPVRARHPIVVDMRRRQSHHDHGQKSTAMRCYSALTHTRHRTRRVPGVPGSAKWRLFNRGCDTIKGKRGPWTIYQVLSIGHCAAPAHLVALYYCGSAAPWRQECAKAAKAQGARGATCRGSSRARPWTDQACRSSADTSDAAPAA